MSHLSGMIEKLRPEAPTAKSSPPPISNSFESCPDDEKIQDTESTNKDQELFATALESFGVDDETILKVAKGVEHSVHLLGEIVMDKQKQK